MTDRKKSGRGLSQTVRLMTFSEDGLLKDNYGNDIMLIERGAAWNEKKMDERRSERVV